jgi:hypothetical protein
MADFGTFTKGNETRTATDIAEAVSLRFNGWAEADTKNAAPKKS